jgi:hypothetical protein
MRVKLSLEERAGLEKIREATVGAGGVVGNEDQKRATDALAASVPTWPERLTALRDLVSSNGFGIICGMPCESNLVLLSVASVFGTAEAVGNGNVLIYDVVPEDVKDQKLPISRTRKAFPLHTDGSAMLVPPDYVILACCVAAPKHAGGATIIVDAEDVAACVRKVGGDDALSALGDSAYPLRLMQSGDWHIHEVPILEVTDRETRVRYRDGMVDEADLERLTSRHRNAFRALETVLRHQTRTQTFQLARGELLALSNWRVLHGRTEIREGYDRRLRRMKIRANESGSVSAEVA